MAFLILPVGSTSLMEATSNAGAWAKAVNDVTKSRIAINIVRIGLPFKSATIYDYPDRQATGGTRAPLT